MGYLTVTLMGHFHVPKREITQCLFIFQPSLRARLSKTVLKNFGTAEFTSKLKNTVYTVSRRQILPRRRQTPENDRT